MESKTYISLFFVIVSCGPGQYAVIDTCNNCPLGHYNPDVGQAKCEMCDPNEDTESMMSMFKTDMSQCISKLMYFSHACNF